MAGGSWDDEESENETPSSPQIVVRRGRFDDEEEDDVLDSWDAAEDSEVEREKAKKAEEAKQKAAEEAKKNHKSKSQRIEERRQENLRRRLANEEEEDDSEEDEADRRARLRAEQIESDLKHAEDLFDGIGVSSNRAAGKHITVQDDDSGETIDLSTLALFNPNTKDQFTQLRDTLAPLLAKNAKKAQYTLFMQEFTKQIVKELPSDQIKKIASGLTTLSNEKMKEEKAAEKGGKKTKAAKTKTSLAGGRGMADRVDTAAYDDGLDDDDFM